MKTVFILCSDNSGTSPLTFYWAVGNETEVEDTNVMFLYFGTYQGHGFLQFKKLHLTTSHLQHNLIFMFAPCINSIKALFY